MRHELPIAGDGDSCSGCRSLATESSLHRMMDTIVKDNTDYLTRKSSNLVFKCAGNASMTMLTLEKADALKESPNAFRIDPDMADISSRPFLITAKRYTWTWYANAYPIPGLAQSFRAVSGCFFVKLILVDDLKAMGMTSLYSDSSSAYVVTLIEH